MIPDNAVWVISNAIRSGCHCVVCARAALEKALELVERAGKPNPYTTGAVSSSPSTRTNWESK